MTRTSSPAFASKSAAASPPGPAPMTSTRPGRRPADRVRGAAADSVLMRWSGGSGRTTLYPRPVGQWKRSAVRAACPCVRASDNDPIPHPRTRSPMPGPKLSPADVRRAAERLPRVRLAHLPTPLEEAPRFAERIGGGVRVLVKRDDCTGLLLGGNK